MKVDDKKDLESCLALLYAETMTKTSSSVYKNRLKFIKQEKFLTISEYRDKIVKNTQFLALCQGWVKSETEHRMEDFFFEGLTAATRIELKKQEKTN